MLLLLLQPLFCEAGEGERKDPLKIQVGHHILRGINLLYDLDFDEAEKQFTKVVARNPDHPVGYFYMAMVTWSRLSTGFWSAEVVNEYVRRIDRTVAVARKSIEAETSDSYTYFYLGGALGFKGRFELMQYNWFNSATLAYEAIQALKTCLKMDPENKDVLLGLGMYDYYTAKLSGVVKFLAYLFLHKGDKDEGLRKLHQAAEEAVYSGIEANSMLVHIYLYMENEYAKALPIVQELSSRFGNNPRYKFFEGIIYSRLDMDSRFMETTAFMRQRSRQEASAVKAGSWAKQVLYLEASDFLFHEQHALARWKLDELLANPDPIHDPDMIAWPLLKKGMSHDLEGNREKARALYNRVLAMENGAGAQFMAKKCITSPPSKGDPFLGY